MIACLHVGVGAAIVVALLFGIFGLMIAALAKTPAKPDG